MSKIAVVDTSCLILFQKIDCLFVLERLFESVITTTIVAAEFGEQLPLWIKIVEPSNTPVSPFRADMGESSVISYALSSTKTCMLILDDLKARKVATEL